MFSPERLDNLVKNGLSKNLLTKFLSIEEQKYLQNQKHVHVYFSNIYQQEERRRAFLTKETIYQEIDFKITVLEFTYNEKYYQLTHRDCLGALMALGIKRDVIGDIILSSKNFILVASEMADFIIHELRFIKNAAVEVKKSSYQDLLTLDITNFMEDKIIVSSYRLDNIVSEVCSISRTKASKMIENQLVKVNGLYKLQGHYRCEFDDILSIRGFGRVIIKEEIKQTRKQNIILRILKTK